MKVLFVGNSHTFFNDMPALFAEFVCRTTGEKPEAVMLGYGGRDLKWHRQEYFALRYNLMYGNYDYCVIQQAAHPYPPKEETLKYGKEIISLCQKTDTIPVIYMTWAEKRFPENQQKMIDTCTELQQETGAQLAPIGLVWQQVLNTYPDIDLFWKDGEHAGPYGDFLIASVLCRVITGRISDTVSGYGFSFMDDAPIDRELPRLIEDTGRIPTALDKEKTDRILSVITSVCG